MDAFLSKTNVQYEDKAQDIDHCSQCEFYLDPGRCQKVQGDISPGGWCKIFSDSYNQA